MFAKAQKALPLLKILNFNILNDGKDPKDRLSLIDNSNFSSIIFKLFLPFFKLFTPDNETVFCCEIDRVDKILVKHNLHSSKTFFNALDGFKERNINFVLAGGKVIDWVNGKHTADSFNDFDLWFLDAESYRKALHYLEYEFMPEKKREIVSKYHLTDFVFNNGEYKFQIMNGIYSDAQDILTDFDLRCCAVAYDGNCFYWLKGALKDIKTKTLTIKNPKAYYNVFQRIQKYIRKGYSVANQEWLKASLCLIASMVTENGTITDWLTVPYGQRENKSDNYMYAAVTRVEKWRNADQEKIHLHAGARGNEYHENTNPFRQAVDFIEDEFNEAVDEIAF